MGNLKTDYNGWTNYETWLTGVWIDNNEADHACVLDLTLRARSLADLADKLRDYIESSQPDIGTDAHGLFVDLMTAAVGRINFAELARHYWDEVAAPNV